MLYVGREGFLTLIVEPNKLQIIERCGQGFPEKLKLLF
jgi:hypothetical protein